MSKSTIFALSFCLLLAFSFVSAQEDAVILDENITAEDLGVSEPTILPDSPFYFFKNITRAIQNIITLDPVKKAELQEKFANEKLMELKKITEKTQDSEVIKKAAENYRKEVANVEKTTARIRETAQENIKVGQFLDKFIKQQTLHQTILQKLESQVPPDVLEKITEAREAHLEKFGQVMEKLESKEKIQERLENNLQQMEGSEFKNFKKLEMLQALEEKAPQAIKEAVGQVRNNVMTRLKEEVKEMTAEKLEQFQTYTESISGVKEKQMEILESLKERLEENPLIQQKLIQTRDRIIEQVREKAPIQDIAPNTTDTAEICATLWKPVCGKDGKTYSNACFAKLAGTEINYEDACKETNVSNQIREQIRKFAPQSTP